jgi:hypothetical protein
LVDSCLAVHPGSGATGSAGGLAAIPAIARRCIEIPLASQQPIQLAGDITLQVAAGIRKKAAEVGPGSALRCRLWLASLAL